MQTKFTRAAKWDLLRLFRPLFACFVLLCAVCLAAVQLQQLIFKHHVDRLIADLNLIELHKTTWTDAQRLMHSWGRWGHYGGACTSAGCHYDIHLEDVSQRLPPLPDWANPVLQRVYPFYGRLGGHSSTVSLSLIVLNGYVVRSGLYARLEVPPDKKSGDEFGYGLVVSAVSLPRLARAGESERFEIDPYQSAARPGGCTICMAATLVYSDHTPPAEVRRLTAINTSCLIGRDQCHTIEDLLPATEPFHLYDGYDFEPSQTKVVAILPHPCTISLWVLGRDASQIVTAERITSATAKPSDTDTGQLVTVRVLQTLKGAPFPPGLVKVLPFQPSDWEPGIAETIEPYHQYFLLGFEHIQTFSRERSDLRLARCSIVEATPAAEAELRRGMALDDELPGEELPHFPY